MFPKLSEMIGCRGQPQTSPGEIGPSVDKLGCVFLFKVPMNIGNVIQYTCHAVRKID